MTSSKSKFAPRASALHIGNVALAALLVLAGIVFQLGEFGYGGLTAHNFWFVAMIVQNLWNMLAIRQNLPSLGELVHFWPLLLVAMGLALFAAPKLAYCPALSSSQRKAHDCE